MTRSAISPVSVLRSATRIFSNTGYAVRKASRVIRLVVLDRVAVGREDFDDLAGGVRLDLVHDLHRLDDAKGLSDRDLLPGLGERGGLR